MKRKKRTSASNRSQGTTKLETDEDVEEVEEKKPAPKRPRKKKKRKPLVLARAVVPTEEKEEVEESPPAPEVAVAANPASSMPSIGNLLLWVLVFGFTFGTFASRYYYKQELSKREERYHSLLDLYSKRKAAGGLSFMKENPGAVASLILLPVLVFGGFLYHRHLLLKRKEKERKMSQRISYGLVAAAAAGFAALRAFLRLSADTAEDDLSTNPLLVTWRSLGFETKAVLGICGFLAVLRRFSGGPPEVAGVPRPPRPGAGSRGHRHRHHRHSSHSHAHRTGGRRGGPPTPHRHRHHM